MELVLTKAITKKTVPTERQEQEALVKWMSYHPLISNFFYKNDNEGARKVIKRGGRDIPIGMISAIRSGLRPGVSDLFIYYPTNTYHGLFLEMKRNKKYTNSERSTPTWIAQEKFQNTVKSVGYAASFCFGWDEGKKIVEEYLKT